MRRKEKSQRQTCPNPNTWVSVPIGAKAEALLNHAGIIYHRLHDSSKFQLLEVPRLCLECALGVQHTWVEIVVALNMCYGSLLLNSSVPWFAYVENGDMSSVSTSSVERKAK